MKVSDGRELEELSKEELIRMAETIWIPTNHRLIATLIFHYLIYIGMMDDPEMELKIAWNDKTRMLDFRFNVPSFVWGI